MIPVIDTTPWLDVTLGIRSQPGNPDPKTRVTSVCWGWNPEAEDKVMAEILGRSIRNFTLRRRLNSQGWSARANASTLLFLELIPGLVEWDGDDPSTARVARLTFYPWMDDHRIESQLSLIENPVMQVLTNFAVDF